jgi:hypothetical protein
MPTVTSAPERAWLAKTSILGNSSQAPAAAGLFGLSAGSFYRIAHTPLTYSEWATKQHECKNEVGTTTNSGHQPDRRKAGPYLPETSRPWYFRAIGPASPPGYSSAWRKDVGNWYRWARKALGALRSEEGGQNVIEFTFVTVVMVLGAPAEMAPIAVYVSSAFFALASKFRVASERNIRCDPLRAPINRTRGDSPGWAYAVIESEGENPRHRRR